jgi:nucleotide-binding universal stress UspA family protein
MMKRILVATDGSEGATRAVEFAAKLAKDSSAELLIVNVVGGYGLPGEVLHKLSQTQNAWFEELLESASGQILSQARDRARAIGVETIKLDSCAGEVAQTLADLAVEKGAEAIVVGKRGAGALTRALMGSVSQKLANLATLPVVVVP